jgi:alkyldihydroxyacetonephosphate synthase
MNERKQRTSRWWGWGEEGKEYPLSEVHPFWDYLAGRFAIRDWEIVRHPRLESLDPGETRASKKLLTEFSRILGARAVTTDPVERLIHASGKSYRDLIRLRTGSLPPMPDVVLYPEKEEDVVKIISMAQAHRAAIVPFGGGSSVVGGVEHMGGNKDSFSCRVTVDLAGMERLLDVDDESRIAATQPGMRGPELERRLNAHGYSLGHFPQSFEFSTVGGWIASRSAGQNSVLYGKIENMVAGLRMVTPAGVISLPPCPASATGPSLKEILVGSEGVLGIITEAALKVHRTPEREDYRGFYFIDFPSGIDVMRETMQGGVTPSVIRLSDPVESAVGFALSSGEGGILSRAVERVGKRIMDLLGYDKQKGCLMICGFDGSEGDNRASWDRFMGIVRKVKAFPLGRSAGRKWRKERFELPYLRDTLLDRGIMVDTLETATTWGNLSRLYDGVSHGITAGIEAGGVQGLTMAHISHIYRDGASLYFTFMAPMVRGREIEQWLAVKDAASKAINECGGTISHHHGIGYEHSSWWKAEFGERGYALLRGVKQAVDPRCIMNPGKFGMPRDGSAT